MNRPFKLTPMYKWHLQHGAHMTEVQGWESVVDYGDVQAEIAAILSSVGLCDASPLTKIDVQGRHSAQMLEGRLGSIPKAGECAAVPTAGVPEGETYLVRLTEERFIVLSSPEEGARLYKRLADDGPDDACVHVTDITSAYAVLQLAGPKSTELMKKLCAVQVDWLASDLCLQCPLVGIRALVVRRKMANVPRWLLLVSRDFGEYAWECVLSVGCEFGIRPFGMAAERALLSAESTNASLI